MKTAVIFYSFNENCALVAEEIKSKLNADLIRLYPKSDKKRGKVARFFWSFGLMIKKNPPLKPYTLDPSVYDLIVIGAPVWAGSPASPIKTFISEAGITGKNIAFFVTHAGGKGNSLEEFKTLFAGNNIVAEADFLDPAKGKEEVKQQIADWVEGLKG